MENPAKSSPKPAGFHFRDVPKTPLQCSKLQITLCTGSRGSVERDGETHCKILPVLSVAQCLKGRYEIGLDGAEPVLLEEGGAFITRPDQPQKIIHHCPQSGGPMLLQWCFFSALWDGFLDVTRCIAPPPVLTSRQAAPFGEVIRGLWQNAPNPGEQPPPLEQKLLWEAKQQALGFRFLELLLQLSKITFPEESYHAILPAIALMDHPPASERIHLEQLAQACSLSVTGFTVLFRQLTGDSPMSFYRSRRLNRAATALLTGSQPLGEIAQATGFYDQFHLSREFKRRYGVSPQQYRQDFYRQNAGKR